MSDFLLIVPEGWTELPAVGDAAGINFTTESLMYSIEQQGWSDVDLLLSSMTLLPEGKAVAQARLIPTGTGYRFWVQFA